MLHARARLLSDAFRARLLSKWGPQAVARLTFAPQNLLPMSPYVRSLLTLMQGNFAEADSLLARAAELIERRLGSEHPEVATVLNNRAGLLRYQVRASRSSR